VIRLVVTDLDGTLWGPDVLVPRAHLDAIESLTAEGVTVMVATARRARVVAEALQVAGLSLPAVVLDGALGIDLRTGLRFHEALFPTDAAVEALAVFRDHGLDPCVYIDDPVIDVVVSDHPSTCDEHLASLESYSRVGVLADAVAGSAVYNFAILGLPRGELEPVAAALTSTGAEVVLHREERFGQWGLVVGPPGVTKWNGVLSYCEHAGISPGEVLAVGDGDNDVEMLRQAAVAVAVRGGTEGAVAAADHLIDPPERDGWSAVVGLVRASG
jgi:hydroxymethylpyrimidine pyrophosphatase-like HAD family hydrolase